MHTNTKNTKDRHNLIYGDILKMMLYGK